VAPDQQYYQETGETITITGVVDVVAGDQIGFIDSGTACGSGAMLVMADLPTSDGHAIVDFSACSPSACTTTLNVCVCDKTASTTGTCVLETWSDWARPNDVVVTVSPGAWWRLFLFARYQGLVFLCV
jgi:hypothetical protein